MLRRIISTEWPLPLLHRYEAQPELPEPGEIVEDSQQDEGSQVAGDRTPGVSHLNKAFSQTLDKLAINPKKPLITYMNYTINAAMRIKTLLLSKSGMINSQ